MPGQGEQQPGEKQHAQGPQVEQGRLWVVVAAGGVAVELVVDKHVIQQPGIVALDQHKPGQCQHGKQPQPGQPGQVPQLAQLARGGQPQQQHQAWQCHPDQALAQDPERTGDKTPPRQPRRWPVPRQKGKGKAPDRHADPAGHQHVVVDILPPHQKAQAAAQHQGCPARQALTANRARRQVKRHQHQPHMQGRHHAQGEFGDAKQRQ